MYLKKILNEESDNSDQGGNTSGNSYLSSVVGLTKKKKSKYAWKEPAPVDVAPPVQSAPEQTEADKFLAMPWYKQIFTKNVARELPNAVKVVGKKIKELPMRVINMVTQGTQGVTEDLSSGYGVEKYSKAMKQHDEQSNLISNRLIKEKDPDKKAKLKSILDSYNKEKPDITNFAPATQKTNLQLITDATMAGLEIMPVVGGIISLASKPAVVAAEVALEAAKNPNIYKIPVQDAVKQVISRLMTKEGAKETAKTVGKEAVWGGLYGAGGAVQQGSTNPKEIATEAGKMAAVAPILAGGMKVGMGALGEGAGRILSKFKKKTPEVTPEIIPKEEAGFTTKPISEVKTEVPKTTAVEDYVNSKTNKFREAPATTQEPLIHPEDLQLLGHYTQYARNPQAQDPKLDNVIRKLITHYETGINVDQTNPKLGKDIENWLQKYYENKMTETEKNALFKTATFGNEPTPKPTPIRVEGGRFGGSKSNKLPEVVGGEKTNLTLPPDIEKITSTKIQELNKQDIANPVQEGNVRMYQATGKGQNTDYYFSKPEDLATFKNNTTVPTDEFKYTDATPERFVEVPGKPGVYKLLPETEKFRLKDDFKNATGITISDDQEKQMTDLGKKIFGDHVDVKITGQILTPKGQEALGSYRDGMIKILGGQADVKDTLYHEAAHAYIDLFTTKNEQIDLLTAAQKAYGIEDVGKVEEKIAEDFINYAKTHEGVIGTLRAHFDNILQNIRRYFGNEDQIKALYSDITTGRAKQALTETKTYQDQIGLVTEALNAGDKEAAKSIYNGITKTDYLPKFEDIVKNNAQQKFAGGLSEQMSGQAVKHQTMTAERDFFDQQLGAENVDNIQKLMKSKLAQNPDFDVSKIKGFDELAQNIRDAKGMPDMTDGEVLDMITALPTRAQINASKPLEVLSPKPLETIAPAKAEEIIKSNEAGGEVTKVPASQLPVGEGKEKVSRLEARVKGITDKVSNMTQDEKDAMGVTTYNALNNKEQLKKAVELIDKDPNYAMSIIKGEKAPPTGLHEDAVHIAMIQKASEDSVLALKLASLKATHEGQGVQMWKELNKNNPVNIITDLKKYNIESMGTGKEKLKTGQAKIDKMVSNEKSNIVSLAKSETIKGSTAWSKLIESIKCP